MYRFRPDAGGNRSANCAFAHEWSYAKLEPPNMVSSGVDAAIGVSALIVAFRAGWGPTNPAEVR